MNMNLVESKNLISELKEISAENVDVKIAPSFTNLYIANSLLESSKIEVVSQDIHHEQKGAYTGEISAEMLLSIGIKTSIIGHSERRKYFNETDLILSKKVNSAVQNSMNIIFCIGEELSDRNNGNHFEIIKSQLTNGVFHLESTEFKSVVIAYEPVWAIGSGITPKPKDINEIHKYIKDVVQSNSVNNRTPKVLYGGSVTDKNAESFFKEEFVDGALVGGASLDGSSFASIVNIFNGIDK